MKICLLFFVILCNFQINEGTTKKSICLNMIVRNEIDTIRRCLSSCKSLIDYWIIVDTGSTDGTQHVIRQFLHDIPGELHQRSWINFEFNRNEALQLAKDKADYILIIDADDIFNFQTHFQFINLDKDFYFMNVFDGNHQHKRIQLFKSQLDFKWKGVLHEYLSVPSSSSLTSEVLENISYIYLHDGSRSKDAKTIEKDIKILEEALVNDPDNARYLFYLGQSYILTKNYPKAIEILSRRFDFDEFDEERFLCLLQIARLEQLVNPRQSQIIEELYWKTFDFRPIRAESLYYLGEYHKNNGNYDECYLISEVGLNIPLPNDILLVENWIYEWGVLLLNSICAWHSNRQQLFFQRCNELLNKDDLPQHIRQMIDHGLQTAHKTMNTSFNDTHFYKQ